MATWYNHAATTFDPETGLFSEDMQALISNPVAIAEGAAGAPRVEGRALGGMFIGSDTISTSIWAEVIDLDLVGFFRVFITVDLGTGGDINVQYSNTNGVSWGATQQFTFLSSGSPGIFTGEIVLNLQTGAGVAVGVHTVIGATLETVAHTVPALCNAVRILASSGGGGFATFSIIGGIE